MTKRTESPPLLDARIRLDQLPTAGKDLEVVADDRQRPAVAADLGLSEVRRLAARLKAVRFRGGIRVVGRLAAEIVQPCVVTFVPVTQVIDEPFDRVFLPADEMRQPTHVPGAEIYVDPESEDDPDSFDGPEVDLTAALLEILALAVDPYPRAPGAELDTTGDPVDEDDMPFAALKGLKPTE
jgi:hypothetical protein